VIALHHGDIPDERSETTVNVTARTDYGVRAIVTLAKASGMLSSTQIAEREQLPQRFLESVLSDLRKAGLVVAHRGTGGGYELGRDPRSITVADVIRSVDGPLASVTGQAPEDRSYPDDAEVIRDLWIATRASLRTVLERVTVADLASGSLPRDVSSLLDDDGARLRR
jgi:Rrf2 family protein